MSRPRLVALLLAFVTLVIFLPVVRCGFINFDDQVYVTENPTVQAGLTWAGVHWAFTTWHGANWHPLTWLSHMLDCGLFGLNPAGHHLVNALIHSANAALVFWLLLRLTGPRTGAVARPGGNLWPSALIAALFAWHPLHVESVAWISERKDVLSTFFALLALLNYARFAQENCRRSFWLALLCFALSLLAKPMFVTLPFVFLLLDFWPLQRITALQLPAMARLVVEKTPFFLLVAVSCGVTYLAQQQGAAVMSLTQLSFSLRFENALIAYGRYLYDTIWPMRLAILYPLPTHLHWIHAAAAAATATLLVFSWLAWRVRREAPYVAVGWLWFLGTLVPVIGLVKVGSMALADRYTYFPLIGLFIAVVFGARDLCARFKALKKPLLVLAVLVLVACVGLTERQLQFWRSSETLFRHAIAVTTENASAHINLGAALENSGRQAEALTEYREAVRITDDNANAHFNIANLLLKAGQPAEALPEYRRATELAPASANFHTGLGSALTALGNFEAATNEFAVAARLDTQTAWPHLETAGVLLKMGRDAEAVDELRRALRIEPDNYQILTTAAHYLAANENAAGRDGRSALALAAKANALAGNRQPFAFDVLGMALAETGDFTNAQTCAQNALDLAAAARLQGTEPIQARLELYRRNSPWRESFRATNAPAK